MMGTNLLAILAILLIPPAMIIQSMTPKTRPVVSLGIENVESRTLAILFICGMLPDPIAHIIIRAANRTPAHLLLKLFSM